MSAVAMSALCGAGTLGASDAAASAPGLSYKDPGGTWRTIRPGDWPAPANDSGRFVHIAGGTTFTVTYRDVTNDTNVGFDDPVLGLTRRHTVGAVLLYIGARLAVAGPSACDVEFVESATDG